MISSKPDSRSRDAAFPSLGREPWKKRTGKAASVLREANSASTPLHLKDESMKDFGRWGSGIPKLLAKGGKKRV